MYQFYIVAIEPSRLRLCETMQIMLYAVATVCTASLETLRGNSSKQVAAQIIDRLTARPVG